MNICKRYYLDITGQPYAVHGPGRCAEFWRLWKAGADTREHLTACPECRAWLEGFYINADLLAEAKKKIHETSK